MWTSIVLPSLNFDSTGIRVHSIVRYMYFLRLIISQVREVLVLSTFSFMWHKGSPFAGFVNRISPVNTLSKRLRKPGIKTAQAHRNIGLHLLLGKCTECEILWGLDGSFECASMQSTRCIRLNLRYFHSTSGKSLLRCNQVIGMS